MDLAGFDRFFDAYGLAALFGIVLLKEIGVPVPIPSDLIMLGAAARAAQGKFPLVAAFLAILVPMVVGGLVQYSIARGPGRRFIYRIGRYIGLTQERLECAMQAIRKGGMSAVVLGLATPGVRIATVPASGLAELHLGAFVPGLVAGSAFFLAWHFAIGFLGGFLLALLTLPLPLLLAIVVLLAALSLVGWFTLRRRRAGRMERLSAAESLAAWSDTACPVCMAIALARERAESAAPQTQG